MIGLSCGVKNNKLIGFLKKTEYYQTWKSIILEDGMNYVEKTCSIKISKSTKEIFKSKIIKKMQISMIFYRQPIYYQVNMSFFMNNSKKLKMTQDHYGLWNR